MATDYNSMYCDIFMPPLNLLVEKIAEQICEILHDYHNYDDFQFTIDHVIRWVSQFDADDQLFLLEEFLYLLRQDIYISEGKARKLLVTAMRDLAKHYNFDKASEFIKHVEFLSLQPEEKSQYTLLKMLDEELIKVGSGLAVCGTKSKKFAIYLDDILASGNTIRKDLKSWLPVENETGKTNLQEVIAGSKILIVHVFGLHTWPVATLGWRLEKELGNNANGISNKIHFWCDYKIENHPTAPNQKFNFAYPVKNQPKEVIDFLDHLPVGYEWAMKKREYAFRTNNKPSEETFFSSPQNRIRFENIILLKGTEILNQVHELNHNQRPLGNINPSFQTLGTGTLFFTWRNISNTTPVVFWWKVNWHYLFPLINRG